MSEDGIMIGLEVHVQLNRLNSKMFCSCSTAYHSSEPNTHICPICMGLPGSLPAINKRAVEYGIKVAIALDSKVQSRTLFYRKNYYYPDLPRGFQISQYDYPLALGGVAKIEGEDGEREIDITRVHMEEDPGRLSYKGTIDRAKYSMIDYNRSGMPLLEVVTEPDLRSPKEARTFLIKLRNILEYLEVFDGDLEGAIRVDANISLAGGARAEIKNISSYKGAEKALLFEITRQKNLLKKNIKVKQETRHFDEARGITISMRTKEESDDYRYFPEPDLIPMEVSDWVDDVKKTLPELPDAKRRRFVEAYEISDYHAKVLTSELDLANFYESVAREIDAKLSATWIADTLKGELNYRDDHFVALRNIAEDPERFFDERKLGDLKIESKISDTLKADLMSRVGSDVTLIEARCSALRLEDVTKLLRMEEMLKKKDPDQIVQKIILAPSVMEDAKTEVEESGVEFKEISLPEMIGNKKFGIGSVSQGDMIKILKMLKSDEITDKGAIEIIRTMLDEGGSPSEIVERKELRKVESDAVLIAVTEAMDENEKAIEDFKSGKKGALNFLVGQVMKKTRGAADPADVQKMLLDRLK